MRHSKHIRTTLSTASSDRVSTSVIRVYSTSSRGDVANLRDRSSRIGDSVKAGTNTHLLPLAVQLLLIRPQVVEHSAALVISLRRLRRLPDLRCVPSAGNSFERYFVSPPKQLPERPLNLTRRTSHVPSDRAHFVVTSLLGFEISANLVQQSSHLYGFPPVCPRT